MPTRREILEGTAIAAGVLLVPRLVSGGGPAAAAPPFVLPPLPYAADALEPFLDAETMRIHHGKHHATYVAKLNEAIAAAPALTGKPVEELLRDLTAIPEAVRTAVRNHGGGHANHTLFWSSLRPPTASPSAPPASFEAAVKAEFGSLVALGEALEKSALSVFGSGWAWLTLGPDRKLRIETSSNQDSPISAGRTPLLGIDVWEHAYYLRYQNRRADYLSAIRNLLDWGAVGRRFELPAG